jgi:hypothetical protein
MPMTDEKKDQAAGKKSATNEPWKHPGQSSQQPGKKPPPKSERSDEDNKTA